MLLNCPGCWARVDGEVKGSFENARYRVSLLRCPSCQSPLVAVSEFEESCIPEVEDTWSEVTRVWPQPELSLDFSIPPTIYFSLEEAKKCLACGTYTASVVMSARALEGVARHFQIGEKPSGPMLSEGLRQLRSSGQIDDRLYKWGQELLEHRKLAAHASGTTFDKEVAEDLFDFVVAVCNYLFVLRERYDNFIKRKDRKRAEMKFVADRLVPSDSPESQEKP